MVRKPETTFRDDAPGTKKGAALAERGTLQIGRTVRRVSGCGRAGSARTRCGGDRHTSSCRRRQARRIAQARSAGYLVMRSRSYAYPDGVVVRRLAPLGEYDFYD